MNPFDNLGIIRERHIFEGRVKMIKRAYIPEGFIVSDNLEDYFKVGLKAKEILKYQRDECSFRWVVWYI